MRSILRTGFFVCLYLAVAPLAFGTPEHPSPTDTDPEKPSWRTKREARLHEVRIDRERSKNVQRTRRLIKETKTKRSSVGQRLLSKGAWLHDATDHFLIFWQAPDTELAKTWAAKAELFLEEISVTLSMTEIAWPRKAEVVLLRNRAFWEKTTQTDPFHQEAFSFPHQSEMYIDVDRTANIEVEIRHHLAHIVLRHYIDTAIRSGATIPGWLNEGWAVYESRGAVHRTLLGKNVPNENDIFPLSDILRIQVPPKEIPTAEQFQAQSAMLIALLIEEYGPEHFRTCLDLLMGSGVPYMYPPKKNLSPAKARKSFVFLIQNTVMKEDFESLEEFETAWRLYLKEKALTSKPERVAE